MIQHSLSCKLASARLHQPYTESFIAHPLTGMNRSCLLPAALNRTVRVQHHCSKGVNNNRQPEEIPAPNLFLSLYRTVLMFMSLSLHISNMINFNFTFIIIEVCCMYVKSGLVVLNIDCNVTVSLAGKSLYN